MKRALSFSTNSFLFFLLTTLLAAPASAGMEFTADSAAITHPYFSVHNPEEFVMLQGFNNYQFYLLYENALKVRDVDGVACLEIERFLLMHTDPGSSGRVYNQCVAQDADGSIWVLKENDTVFGSRKARLLLPAAPEPGFNIVDEDNHTLNVAEIDASITLQNGMTYNHCLKLEETTDGQDISTYYAPDVGIVYILDGHDNTFEFKTTNRE